MYKVINRFKEINHDGHIYEVGDVYPGENNKLVKSRAEFLCKKHPEYGVAFLEVVEEAKPVSTPKKEEPKKSDK